MKSRTLVFLLLAGFTFSGFTQHQENTTQHHAAKNHETFKRHRLAFEFGYAYIPDGFEEEPGDQSVFVPTFGLEYFYRLNHKWALGATAAIETGNYLIREDLPRENAFIMAALVFYEVLPRWAVFGGVGMEIEHHQNFGLFRLGTDYEFPIGKGWDVSPTFSFDHKEEYNTWELVFSIGKHF